MNLMIKKMKNLSVDWIVCTFFPVLYKYVSFRVLHILKLSPLLLYHPFLLLLFVFRTESNCVSMDKDNNAFFLGETFLTNMTCMSVITV